jgi:hypothetical protein
LPGEASRILRTGAGTAFFFAAGGELAGGSLCATATDAAPISVSITIERQKTT